MINDLPLFFDMGGKNPLATRPIRMGFFHFSNNNLSVRKQCARDVGMYDPAATKAEDVDLCFRVALSPNWLAWRENEAIVRHKGRDSVWKLLTQMWSYGFYVGLPYAKTRIRGLFLYWLNGRNHSLAARFETEHFPILVCAFITEFYFVTGLLLGSIAGIYSGHFWIALLAIAGLFWMVPRYLFDVRDLGLNTWDTFKLAIVHYLANVFFITAAFISALRHGLILIPSSVFKLQTRESPLEFDTNQLGRQSVVEVRAAESYIAADDLWSVTCYFNPQSSMARLANYEHFKEAFERGGARLLTVECAFENQPFVLSGPNVIQVRASDVMWQKERLLNIAISELPSDCRKVAWLDCDILFENPMWLVETSRLLDRFALLQPFQTVAYPPKGHLFCPDESTPRSTSFASVFRSAPTQHLLGDFRKHGHTGFVWAARREVLGTHGLYDACIAGDGDHMMAHAACGDWDSACVFRSIIGFGHRNHFRPWAAEFYREVRGRMTYVPGTILHLWHGDPRDWYQNFLQLAAEKFDPSIDIRLGAGRALEWNSAKPDLHRFLAQCFATRMDGAERASE